MEILFFVTVFFYGFSLLVYFHFRPIVKNLRKHKKETKNEKSESYIKPSQTYHKCNDPYYMSDIPFNHTNKKDDSFYDVTSPSCPWGMYSWN